MDLEWKESGMGRHAADRRAPGSPDPKFEGISASQGPLRHADLFVHKSGRAAARFSAEHAAETFDRLVEPHRAALHAYVLRNTHGNEAVAYSVLKETLYRAAQEPGLYPRHAAAVRPWLILTARHVLHDGERHAPAGHGDRPPTQISVPVGSSERRPAQRPAVGPPATTVVAAMKELTTEHRELIIRTFYNGDSLEAVAADRGVPVTKIKLDLFVAMRTLRAVLDRQVTGRHGGR
jgi:RNA polymerase sigma-70 factor (ECF subfamily)